MRRKPKVASGQEAGTSEKIGEVNTAVKDKNAILVATRSPYVILALFVLVINGSWGVYHYQFENLPPPLALESVGKRGFSENEAMKHVVALTQLGPHSIASDALERAFQYVREAAETIKKTAHWEVDVEVDLFHANSGVNNQLTGLFRGKSVVYSDLNHVVLRITPKYASEAADNAILVSSHIDTVFAGEGAGDCSSCVAVMLELARGVSQWAHGFKNAVIFLFNIGEEEGLNGAHSFISQHPWSDTLRLAIDLEAMGIGGKSSIFQAGPHPWAIENFALAAKYPSAQIVAQDLFYSGIINSATDFQVYKDIAGLSGLDFAYADNTAVYHTKNDKLKLLKPGSLQHLGENVLAFLLHAAASASLPKSNTLESDIESSKEKAIYFDILGAYMVTFRQSFANMLYNSVILQSILIWATSVVMGGYPAAISLLLSCFSIILMWICSISFSVAVAFILTITSSPMPCLSSPWLVIGLFAAPALLGAFTGQHLGYIILKSYLLKTFSVRKAKLSADLQSTLAKLDAERWLFKAGILQWLVLLAVGNYYKVGSSYIALVWLVSPAFAYGLLEATLSPSRVPLRLKTLTLLIGLFVPLLLSSGMIIRLTATIIGTMVRFIRNPGATPEWVGNVVIAIFVAAIVCLTMVYLLSYIHISEAKVSLVFTTCTLLAISLVAVWGGLVLPFTEDTARAVNVVHVVDARQTESRKQEPSSFVSLFSVTPGKLNKEAEYIGEGVVCGRDRHLDFVTFSVNYSCWTSSSAEAGWVESDVPKIHVDKDTKGESRTTHVSIDTRTSTRWALGINTKEIEDFQLKDAESAEELISPSEKHGVNGWHVIQFSGGKKAPTKFDLSLFWMGNHTLSTPAGGINEPLLLKLRTDLDRSTPPFKNILQKLPPWCSQFGKSTAPHTLAFLSSLPVSF
ncbi:uncharacterized protein [Henckelia pumila]